MIESTRKFFKKNPIISGDKFALLNKFIMDQSSCREMEERKSIRDTCRKLKKYGSTSKHVIRNDNLIKHIISKSDTLAGIALKYEVTTEQIRRINKLWASDSIFLRQYLMVPAIKNTVVSTSCDNKDEASNSSAEISDSKNSTETVPSSTPDDSTIDNFLAKMDSSIATVKKDIKKTQGNSAFNIDDDDLHLQRRVGISRLRHSHPHSPLHNPHAEESPSDRGPSKTSSQDNVHDLPSAVVMTSGKKLRTSLQKLQQQQDEIFQL